MDVSTEENAVDMIAVIIDVGLMVENSPVLQSQVGDQLLQLRALGLRVKLLAVSRDRVLFEKSVGARLRAAGVRVELVDDRGFARNLWNMAATLRRLRRSVTLRHAYVRSLWGPLVLALASGRRPAYVYDVRGSVRDEATALGTSALKVSIYEMLENWGIRGATAVSAVSTPLADRVRVRRGSQQPVVVVPCCVEIAALPDVGLLRAQRAAFGFSAGHLVLVYSGGLTHYQQVPAMLELWRELRNEPDVRFLLLTNQAPNSVQAITGSVADFGEQLVHRSLSREEVAVALASCDVGFMLRDRRELNRVASPVKFPEYLAAGLAVVGSPGTGDVSELIVAHDVGALVDPADLRAGVAAVRALLARLRSERAAIGTRARSLAASRYNWAAYAPTFQSLYR